ncbi:mitochondrial fission factor-like isoform X3 [Hemiscyllium ocellatum]|uniref:mitochondrial fission factor-like isoform X3 n=1 Tax=Hemiscyllium ocellatum TaxID=170820 RepID=UPI002967673B|nr:mitochondrial fission factor-like isoform X3 [Hemiscyllium ocellatum]
MMFVRRSNFTLGYKGEPHEIIPHQNYLKITSIKGKSAAMTEPVFAAPSDLIDSGPAPCDLSFMEVIGQKMRIPNRLKVTEEQEEEEEKAEDIHLSTLQMQIPERISMGETEMQDIGARPYLYGWFHNNPSITDPPPLSISPNLIFGPSHALNMDRPESPVQTTTTQHSSRSRALSENEICLSSVSRRQRNLNRFHNQSLSRRLYSDGINQARYSSMTHDYTVPEGVLGNFSVMEIVTLRRQLNKLNRRLQLLEQESRDHARKEFVLYSIIIAACFVNSWLWLRK